MIREERRRAALVEQGEEEQEARERVWYPRGYQSNIAGYSE